MRCITVYSNYTHNYQSHYLYNRYHHRQLTKLSVTNGTLKLYFITQHKTEREVDINFPHTLK